MRSVRVEMKYEKMDSVHNLSQDREYKCQLLEKTDVIPNILTEGTNNIQEISFATHHMHLCPLKLLSSAGLIKYYFQP